MPSAIQITVPRRFRGRQDGVAIHHAHMPDADRTRVNAVPVTTIARTLQDVAATSDPALVEQAVAQAVARGTPSVALQRLRKEAAYHRLFYRLQRAAPDSWAVKGGRRELNPEPAEHRVTGQQEQLWVEMTLWSLVP